MSFHLGGFGRFSFMSSPGGAEVVSIQASGSSANVGIGTDNPLGKLDVRGDIRLGSTGQFYAPAAQENLRIVRGVVTAAGGIITGTGFTVTRAAAGQYAIIFTTPFTAPPTVTASTESQGGLSRVAMTDGVTASVANIRVTGSTTGVTTDAPFHFIAIGPR